MSARIVQKNLHNSLRLLAKFGAADYFITMTADPSHSADALREAQRGCATAHRVRYFTDTANNPELGVKCFRARLLQLLADLRGGALGRYKAH